MDKEVHGQLPLAGSWCRPVVGVETRRPVRRPLYAAHARRGVEVLELILVTPVIVIVLVASMQFGSVHVIESALTHAATVGAREGAQYAPVDEIAEEVDAVLEPHGIDVVDTLGQPGDGTYVILEVGDDITEFGDPTFDPDPPAEPEYPAIGPGEVRVTVYVKLDKTPILNVSALEDFGFVFPGEFFQISSVTKLE